MLHYYGMSKHPIRVDDGGNRPVSAAYLCTQPSAATPAATALNRKAITITIAAEFDRLAFFSVGGSSSGFWTILHHASPAKTRNRNPRTPNR